MLGGGIYPGMITATVGTVLLDRGRRDVGRDREAPPALRVVVRRAPARLRRHRARLVPPDPDRQRARARHDRRRLLARAVRRDARAARRLPRPRAGRRRAALPAARRGRRRGRARASSRSGSRAAASTGCTRTPASSSSGASSTRGRWWTAHPFSLSAAPDGRSLRITVKALGDHTARMGEIPIGTRVVAEGPFGVFTDGVAPPREGAADRRRHRDHAGARAAASRCAATSSSSIASSRPRTCSSGESSTSSPRAAGAELHYVVGDHATDEGRRLPVTRRTCASSSPTSPSATSTSAARRR